jgi:hypothetical protein
MTDILDLAIIERTVRQKPQLRHLGCPKCGGDVRLEGGLLHCEDCEFVGHTLGELAPRGGAYANVT